MKRFNNEKGAALILTVFIITIMLLFILTLFYQVQNTTKQVSTVSKQNNAENLAKMGVDYYYHKLKFLYKKDSDHDLEAVVKTVSNANDTVHVDSDRSFELMTLDLEADKITITCKGTAFGREAIEENVIKLDKQE
ncbi:hypothetical protein WMZ97_09115 [Lentibacillus sp. N15]|uniref:hypothetical protein n=1 Tax=Lentibacillus songyuanensis TaxID=3136161 RepID=UPI0031BBA1AE